jgi:hypothetical protein
MEGNFRKPAADDGLFPRAIAVFVADEGAQLTTLIE